MFENLKQRILENYDSIFNVLCELESPNTAIKELNQSIEALSKKQKLQPRVDQCAVFLPMNLPLYSLITFVVLPKRNCHNIYYRPSKLVEKICTKLNNLLALEEMGIHIIASSRKAFIESYAKNSDVVIFVGKHENAMDIESKLTDQVLFLYFGVGYNPVIIMQNCNLINAVDKVSHAVLFNSGQDCAKPNLIFVHKDVCREFIDILSRKVSEKRCELLRLEDFHDLMNYVCDNTSSVENKFECFFENNKLYVSPVISVKNFNINICFGKEIYGPLFNIIVFEKEEQLIKYFTSSKYFEHSMYISHFGDSFLYNDLYYIPFLNEKIVDDVDIGYEEYGGFGTNTSYIKYRGLKISKPLLINREIEMFYLNKEFNLFMNRYTGNIKKKMVIFDMVKSAVSNIFKNNLYFAFIFGSFSKESKNQTSQDVDLFICLKKNDLLNTERFRRWYFLFHFVFGMVPDFIYPVEIVTLDELNTLFSKGKNLNLDIDNDSEAYDIVFYTQIFLDKKNIIQGEQNYISLYKHWEDKLYAYSKKWCKQIVECMQSKQSDYYNENEMKLKFLFYKNDLNELCKYVFFKEKLTHYSNDILQEIESPLFKILFKQQMDMLENNLNVKT